MLFIETSAFTRLVTATLNDADYAALQQSLAELTPAQIRQFAEAARVLK